MEPKQIIEAALFTAGKPLDLKEIAGAIQLEEDIVRKILKKLIDDYKRRETAIEIVKIGPKYSMQLKTEYAPYTNKFAPIEIPKEVLKTAALIAYYQPIKQSELLRMVGSKVYEHVKVLDELNLIKTKIEGRTFALSTSKRFPEYFGINATKRDDIKKWLAEKVGVKIESEKLLQTSTLPQKGEKTESPTPQIDESSEKQE